MAGQLSRLADSPLTSKRSFVMSQEGDSYQARLLVKGRLQDNLDAFRTKYGVDVASSPLNLERMFPLLLQETG